MATREATLLIPGHGGPIFGADRVRQALTETAEWLEALVSQTLALMNAGATLEQVVREVQPPAHLAGRPYLQPVYDEPQYAVRNVWRLYGGWYDGNKGPFHRYLGWSNPEDWRISQTEVVSWITGAAIMIRRADFVALGGFDADTYRKGYFEDVDLCERVKQAGKQVYYCPDATLVHDVGSTGGNPEFFMENSRRFHARWDKMIVSDSPFIHVNY